MDELDIITDLSPEFWQGSWEDLQDQLSTDEQWARDIYMRQHPLEF